MARRGPWVLAVALVATSCTGVVGPARPSRPPTTAGPATAGPDQSEVSAPPEEPPGWVEGACPLESELYPSALPEGETDYDTYLRPEGTVRGALVGLRFRGGEAPLTPREIASAIGPVVDGFYRAVSHGKVRVKLVPVPGVHELNLDSSHYADPNTHLALLDAAVKAGDKEVDFSKFDFVVAAAFGGTDIENSFAYTAVPGLGILADGVRHHHLVYLGTWFDGTDSAADAMIHEMGHLFGLPDLYSYEDRGEHDVFKHAGGWDPMSVRLPGRTFLAWHQHKLGFLRPGELACLREGERRVELQPLAEGQALKAVQIRLNRSKAYVVEVRERVGLDREVCEPGVLVYLVDAAVRSGRGPVKVMGSGELRASYPCGALADATIGLRAGQGTVFRDDPRGVMVRVLDRAGSGYRILVRKV